MKVLITNAEARNGLALTRALGRMGVAVETASYAKHAQAFYSKYSHKHHIYHNPADDTKQCAMDLLKLVRVERYDALFPVGTDVATTIACMKSEFSRYTSIPFPGKDKMLKAHDKWEAYKMAKRVGIPVPETHLLTSLNTTRKLANHLDFPKIIKIRRGSGITNGLRYANNPSEFIMYYNELTSKVDNPPSTEYSNPIAQEIVPGDIYDVPVLLKDGEIRASLVMKRIHQLPPSKGGGVYNITIRDDVIRGAGEKLMEAYGWDGIAMVEFKKDEHTGEYKLLEINPKFWGTSDLAIEAGINFPYLALKMLKKGDISPQLTYRVGLKYRWIFPEEVLYILMSEHKLINALDLIKLNPFDTKTNIWIRDPLPNLRQLITTLAAVYRYLSSKTPVSEINKV